MTVPSAVSRSGPYPGNGITTVFNYNFRILDPLHIDVLVSAPGVPDRIAGTGEYSVNGVGGDSGSVTFVVAPAVGETINIVRNTPFEQEIDLENQGEYYAEVVESGFDLSVMRDQQLSERIDRAIVFPIGDQIAGTALPSIPDRANSFFAFDDAGSPMAVAALYLGAELFEVERFVTTSPDTSMVLATTPISDGVIEVWVEDSLQSGWSRVGDTITLTGTPAGLDVWVKYYYRYPLLGISEARRVTYNVGLPGSIDRTVSDALGDRLSAPEFASVQQAVDTGRIVHLPPVTYPTAAVTVPAGGSLEADANTVIPFTFNGPLRKGNRFSWSGDYDGTMGQLGHGSGSGDNKGLGHQSAIAAFRGTDIAPDTTAMYARTAGYIEMHSALNPPVGQSSWSSQFMIPAFTVEHQAHAGTEASISAGAFRAYSKDPPTNNATGRKNLVGVSAIGQTNMNAGEANWNVWGANLIASEVDGLPSDICAGVEIDLVHKNGATAATGPGPGNNYTGCWVVSDADNQYSTAAFFANRTTRSLGWNYILYTTDRARDWMVYLRNTLTTGAASGINIQTSAATGTAMRASTEDYNNTAGNGPNVLSAIAKASGSVQTQFVVTSNALNPVQAMMGGVLKVLKKGPNGSGATAGHSMVEVLDT